MKPGKHTISRSSDTDEPAAESRRRCKGNREPPLAESFHLLVKCNDEDEQRNLYERLTAEGRSCRVLSL